MAAALALHQSSSWLTAMRAPLARMSLAAAFLPAFLAAPKPFSWAMPALPSLLELFPPWLLAVPKKKTSHSRKAMRSANKGLKDKENLLEGEEPVCGAERCYRVLEGGLMYS
ncbi:hypothetical protein VTO73DRAFT_1133 [Trametes versicolor]